MSGLGHQKVSQSVSPSVSQSVSHLAHQSVSPSVRQSVSPSVRQSVSQSVSQSVIHSVSQSVSQSVNQLILPTNLPYQSSDWGNVFPTNKEKDIWALADHLFDHVTKCLCAWNDKCTKRLQCTNIYQVRVAVNADTNKHNMNAKAIHSFKWTLRYDAVVLRVLSSS